MTTGQELRSTTVDWSDDWSRFQLADAIAIGAWNCFCFSFSCDSHVIQCNVKGYRVLCEMNGECECGSILLVVICQFELATHRMSHQMMKKLMKQMSQTQNQQMKMLNEKKREKIEMQKKLSKR